MAELVWLYDGPMNKMLVVDSEVLLETSLALYPRLW